MPPQPTYNLKKIILFGIMIVVIAGLVGFYFVNRKNAREGDGTKDPNLFPFGNGTNQGTTGTGTGVVPEPTPDTAFADQLQSSSEDRLRLLTNYPVTNFFASIVQKTIEEPKLDEMTGTTKLVPITVAQNRVRWNVKENGIVMDGDVSSDSIIVSQKTATEIPLAEELWIGNNGNTFVFRSWADTRREIDSFVTTIPTPKPLSYCSVPFTSDLKSGTKNTQVAELQKYIGTKLNMTVTADGSFGPKTATLVKQVQKLLGVAETGMVESVTRDAINADCANVRLAFEKEQNEPVKLTGTLLGTNILRGSVSSDGSQVFFLKKVEGGVSGIVSKIDGTGQKIIFQSPMTEWMPQWVNATTIAMTTLASGSVDGYLYFLDPMNGNFKKVLGPVRGLTTTVSPDAKMVWYSQSINSTFVTRWMNLETGASRDSDLDTLPAKCTWQDSAIIFCGVPRAIPSALYPDEWYQGIASFEDTLWSINTATGATTMVVNPDQKFDMTKLQMSPDKNYVYFINKNDGALWSYRVGE